MTFSVGQKVVCVDAAVKDGCYRLPGHDLRVGAIYTIHGFTTARSGHENVELAELPKPNGFLASRFRPLIDTTKQVEAIKSLIAPIFEGKEVELVR
jgi:hypothetical protein